MFKVSSIQLNVGDERNKDAQIEYTLAQMDTARDADLILLPEIWNIGYFSFEYYKEQSEAIDGPTVQAIAEKARQLNSYVYAGSIVESSGGKLYNTAILLDNMGKIVDIYRKMHLFGYGSKEKQLLSPGEDVVTVETDLGTLGLATCYDLRFPELYRRMMEQGAEIFLVTAAWPFPRLANWVSLNQVRALENISYLISCNCSGVNRGQRFLGHSMVVDPWGIIRAGSADDATIVSTDIDPLMVKQIRNQFPPLQDRVLKL